MAVLLHKTALVKFPMATTTVRRKNYPSKRSNVVIVLQTPRLAFLDDTFNKIEILCTFRRIGHKETTKLHLKSS